MSRLRPLLDLRILGHTSGAISLCDDQKPRISTVSGIKLKQRNVKSIIEEGSSPVPLENLEMFEGTGIILLSFSSPMLSSLTAVFATLSSVFRSRSALQLENLALRHEIGVFQRAARKRPKLTPGDRLLWVWLSRIWTGWRSALALRFQVLYVFLVLAHDRRRIVHCNVTAHPTAEWTGQQLREAFPFDQLPRYLLHDRDASFGDAFRGHDGLRPGEAVVSPS